MQLMLMLGRLPAPREATRLRLFDRRPSLTHPEPVAIEGVVAVAGIDRVVAEAADEHVAEGAAVNEIVPGSPVDIGGRGRVRRDRVVEVAELPSVAVADVEEARVAEVIAEVSPVWAPFGRTIDIKYTPDRALSQGGSSVARR